MARTVFLRLTLIVFCLTLVAACSDDVAPINPINGDMAVEGLHAGPDAKIDALADAGPPDLAPPDRAPADQAPADQMLADQPPLDHALADKKLPDQLPPDQMLPDQPPGNCNDQAKNGTETDVDCGGVCDPCAAGKGCGVNGDCQVGTCDNGKCVPPALQVSDGTTTSFETLTSQTQVVSITGTAILQNTVVTAPYKKGDEVLLINLQGTDADHAAVGSWELLKVTAVSGANVIVETPPTKVYGNAGSNASLTGQKVYLIKVPLFSNVTIAGTLTAKAWGAAADKLGVIALRATSKLSVAATGAIVASHLGYRSYGASPNMQLGKPGEWVNGMPTTAAGAANGGAGGGGAGASPIGAGGGGASYGTVGAAGTDASATQVGGAAGAVYGQADLAKIFLGAGGGAGGGGNSGPGTLHATGAGGGIILIFAPTIDVQGKVSANGEVGGDNTCAGTHLSASGGGGSGGSIYLRGTTVTLTTAQVSALGGPGGCPGGGAMARGGFGGVGRIRVDYGTLNGSAYPNGNKFLTNPEAYPGQITP